MHPQLASRQHAACRAARGLLLTVATIAGVLVLAPAAQAAYPIGVAMVDDQLPPGSPPSTLSFRAVNDVADDVVVTVSVPNFVVTNSSPITAGSGCTQDDPNTVSCPTSAVARIRVVVGTFDDSVTINPNVTVPAIVFGGPGADKISTRDGAADSIACGDDVDPFVVADALDTADRTCEKVDNGIAPETTITTGPPDPSASNDATFEFTSSKPGSTFQCSLDGEPFMDCSSPKSYTALPAGLRSFSVVATDEFGNADQTPDTRQWTIATGAPTPPAQSSRAAPPVVPTPSSLVLIAGRAAKVSKSRYATVVLNCSGTKDCAGTVVLQTSKPVRLARKRIVRLGAAKFKIAPARTVKVRVRLSRRNMRLVRRLRRVKTDVIVKDLDRVGRARVSTRTILLKAPR